MKCIPFKYLTIFTRPRTFVTQWANTASPKHIFFLTSIGGFCGMFLIFNNFSNVIMLNFLDNLLTLSLYSVFGVISSMVVIYGIAVIIWAIYKTKINFQKITSLLSVAYIPIIIAFLFLMFELFFYVSGTAIVRMVVVGWKFESLYPLLNSVFNSLVYLFKFLRPAVFLWSFIVLFIAIVELISNIKFSKT